KEIGDGALVAPRVVLHHAVDVLHHGKGTCSSRVTPRTRAVRELGASGRRRISPCAPVLHSLLSLPRCRSRCSPPAVTTSPMLRRRRRPPRPATRCRRCP